MSSGPKKKKFESPRVPVLPDGGVSPNPNGRPPPVPNKAQAVISRSAATEKSPRFVRKHDSFKEQKEDQRNQPKEQVIENLENDGTRISFYFNKSHNIKRQGYVYAELLDFYKTI